MFILWKNYAWFGFPTPQKSHPKQANRVYWFQCRQSSVNWFQDTITVTSRWILTFCWNQRMDSGLRMRCLYPMRPRFLFLSAMLKPGLPRTWGRKPTGFRLNPKYIFCIAGPLNGCDLRTALAAYSIVWLVTIHFIVHVPFCLPLRYSE